MKPYDCKSGVVEPVSLILVALLALGGGVFLGNWHPFEAFKPKPPTEQLTALQVQLTAAQVQAEEAKKEKDLAIKEERIKFEAQVRAVQQDNYGTNAALQMVPVEHQVAEVKLGKAMAFRESLKLAAMIGALPAIQQEEMLQIIEGALSGKQAEIDEANAKLAQKDAEFRILTKERDAIKAQIPVLEQKLSKAEETAKAVQVEVTKATEKVKKWADLKAEADLAASSFGASFDKARNIIILIVCAYLFLAFVLPGLVKHMEAGRTKNALRALSGYATSPLLYQDAAKKLDKMAAAIEKAIPHTGVGGNMDAMTHMRYTTTSHGGISSP